MQSPFHDQRHPTSVHAGVKDPSGPSGTPGSARRPPRLGHSKPTCPMKRSRLSRLVQLVLGYLNQLKLILQEVHD